MISFIRLRIVCASDDVHYEIGFHDDNHHVHQTTGLVLLKHTLLYVTIDMLTGLVTCHIKKARHDDVLF